MIRGRVAKNRKRRIVSAVRRWYRKNGRVLPWRCERNPYRVLVSEIMLQQTQVSRVLMIYPQFLKKYPTLRHLARARMSSVIRAWEGMGYNNRALRIRKLAQRVVSEFHAVLPRTIEELRTLPGVGRYTASAVACFAFGLRVPVVDTNISRILGRLFAFKTRNVATHPFDAWARAEEMLPHRNAGEWNQALMDLGATVCTAASPRCDRCPLLLFCPSAHRIHKNERRTARLEPGRDDIPNRIYRGRIVQALRSLKPGGTMPPGVLARKIKVDIRQKDRRWFQSLLHSLERDGLIQWHGRSRISLPD